MYSISDKQDKDENFRVYVRMSGSSVPGQIMAHGQIVLSHETLSAPICIDLLVLKSTSIKVVTTDISYYEEHIRYNAKKSDYYFNPHLRNKCLVHYF